MKKTYKIVMHPRDCRPDETPDFFPCILSEFVIKGSMDGESSVREFIYPPREPDTLSWIKGYLAGVKND